MKYLFRFCVRTNSHITYVYSLVIPTNGCAFCVCIVYTCAKNNPLYYWTISDVVLLPRMPHSIFCRIFQVLDYDYFRMPLAICSHWMEAFNCVEHEKHITQWKWTHVLWSNHMEYVCVVCVFAQRTLNVVRKAFVCGSGKYPLQRIYWIGKIIDRKNNRRTDPIWRPVDRLG